MKKKIFLKSIAVLAATMALEAGAALPQSLTEQPSVTIGSPVTSGEITTAPIPFVLERPVLTGTLHAQHRSHSSHSSHRSHVSSRY